jgi:hypothetical protein
MHACMHACMFVCMYVCMYYIRTCYVLTKPPIPSSRCKHYVILRPVEILLHERGYPRVPLVNPLNNVFIKFMMQITSEFLLVNWRQIVSLDFVKYF